MDGLLKLYIWFLDGEDRIFGFLVVLPAVQTSGTSGFGVAHKVEVSGASDCGF